MLFDLYNVVWVVVNWYTRIELLDQAEKEQGIDRIRVHVDLVTLCSSLSVFCLQTKQRYWRVVNQTLLFCFHYKMGQNSNMFGASKLIAFWNGYLSLRAVSFKDQLRSCNIEKTDFPKLCQNEGLGELVLKICLRSFRFSLIFFGFFFVFCALSGWNWHRNRAFSGSSSLKSGSVIEKINPRNQKTLFPLLIAGENFERELNLNFWQIF